MLLRGSPALLHGATPGEHHDMIARACGDVPCEVKFGDQRGARDDAIFGYVWDLLQ